MSDATIFIPEQLWMPGFIANPYPTYHYLRDQSPLNFMNLPAGAVAGVNEPIRAWALMKHDDVYNALRDHETFASGRNPLVGKGVPKLTLIMDDPPRHTYFRRLVNKTFTLKRIEALTPWITSVVTELLDEIGTTETDMVPSYTIPLPVRVIARLLGIPGEEYLTFKRWSDALMATSSMPPEERAQSTQERDDGLLWSHGQRPPRPRGRRSHYCAGGSRSRRGVTHGARHLRLLRPVAHRWQ
jgi:cytochrome P450